MRTTGTPTPVDASAVAEVEGDEEAAADDDVEDDGAAAEPPSVGSSEAILCMRKM